LYTVARKALKVVALQVAYRDFDLEFKIELNLLAAELLALTAGDCEEKDNSTIKFQRFVKGTLPRLEGRPLVWKDWSQLDWKKEEDAESDERFPCPLAFARFNISKELNKDLAVLKVCKESVRRRELEGERIGHKWRAGA
jgi:hypothetical protein